MGLLFGVVVPLLAIVLFLVLFLPYQEGLRELKFIDDLIADGFIEDARYELDRFEKSGMQSLFLKSEIEKRRGLLQSDLALEELFILYSGLQESYAEFRREFPNGGVVEFSGNWSSLQDKVASVTPGTIIIIKNSITDADSPLVVNKAIGLIGSSDNPVISGDLPDHSKLIGVDGTAVLMAGLSFEDFYGETSKNKLIIGIFNGHGGLHNLSFRSEIPALQFFESSGMVQDCFFAESSGPSVMVDGQSSILNFKTNRWESNGTGLMVTSGAEARLDDCAIFYSSDRALHVTDPGSEVNLVQCSVNEGAIGM
jgi:hypothetical protein